MARTVYGRILIHDEFISLMAMDTIDDGTLTVSLALDG